MRMNASSILSHIIREKSIAIDHFGTSSNKTAKYSEKTGERQMPFSRRPVL